MSGDVCTPAFMLEIMTICIHGAADSLLLIAGTDRMHFI